MMRSRSQVNTQLSSLAWLQRLGAVLCIFLLSACASLSSKQTSSSSFHKQKKAWTQSVLQHSQSLPDETNLQRDEIFEISEEMRSEVIERFGHLSKNGAIKVLAKWLIDEDGHNMRYDTDANLTPLQAYNEKRGNCLSFTLLLHALAKELDVQLEYNSVDIPSSWNYTEDVGMIYYRHVNAVQKSSSRRKQIFDLALELYDPGYPQKVISESQALAMFMNNFTIMHLKQDDFDKAAHFSKLGIAYAPNNADLWVNLGVVLKRSGKLVEAEYSFLHAYEISNRNLPAVSNLERLYRQQNKPELAALYADRATRVRSKNPYMHYIKARDFFVKQQYDDARQSTNRAITLHGNDPRFYELKSRIEQAEGNYRTAMQSLKKAYAVSEERMERKRYAFKLDIVRQNHRESLNR